MKHPGFIEGVVVALMAAFSASLLYSSATLLIPAESALRLTVAMLSLGYSLYLFRRSQLRTGRVSILVGWLLVSLLSITPFLSLSSVVLFHSGVIWLLRSRYLHANMLKAVIDLGLVAVGLMAAVWATLQSGNLFLAVWALFLVQALFVFIPNLANRRRGNGATDQDPFTQAHQSAQLALQKLKLHR